MIHTCIHGKFNTVSRRRAGVVVSGNNVYVSENSFRQYANYKYFWIYSNDSQEANRKNINVTIQNTSSYTRYVSTQSANLNVRSGAGTNYSRVGSLAKGTAVTVYEIAGSWSRIGTNRWVSSQYLSASPVSTSSNSKTKGQTRKIKASTLYSNSNLSGTRYNYKANTTVTILSNVSSNVDKIKVNATGRVAYINTNNYTNSSTSNSKISKNYSTTVGKYYRLKNRTILYSKGNLTGTKYNYLAKTQIKVISHYSSNVDYVYIVKTGRYAYCRISEFR